MKTWKLNRVLGTHYLEVEGGSWHVSRGDGHYVLVYVMSDPPWTRTYHGWYETAEAAMAAMPEKAVAR